MPAQQAGRPASRGPYRKGIRRRAEIVAAAAGIFAKYGYNAGSLRQIAAEVGISAATLVSHFDHKEGLLIAVLEHWKEEAAAVKEGVEGLDYFRRLPALMEYHTQHRGLIELFLTMCTEATYPEHPAWAFVREHRRHTLETFTAHLLAAGEAGSIAPMGAEAAEAEIRGLVALMDGLEMQWLLDPDLDLVAVFTRHLDQLIQRWAVAGAARAVAADDDTRESASR